MESESIKVLLADKSESVVMYLSILLNRMGIDKVIPADSGIETLKLLKMFTPDVVLLNTQLNDTDGIDVLREIKSSTVTRSIPVIMLSRTYDIHVHEECKNVGCSGFLIKPVSVYSLNNSLHESITLTGGKKRKFLRTSLEKKVIVKHNDVMDNLYALTLSEGGIYIRMKKPFPIGTDVEVLLKLGDDRPFEVKGTVIYHHKSVFGDEFKIAPGMAIEFTDMNVGDAMLLRDYITETLSTDIIEEQDEPVITI